MNIVLLYKIIFILTAFGAGSIAVSLFLKRKKNTPFEKFFGLMSTAFVIWAAGRFGVVVSSSANEALFWIHILYNGSILVHVLFLHTILLFLKENKKIWNKIILIIFYLLNAFLFFVNNLYYVSGNRSFISGVLEHPHFNYLEIPGEFYYIHLINYILIPLYSFTLMFLCFLKARSKRRHQIVLVMISSIVGFVGGNSIVPIILGYNIEPVFLVLVPIYIPVLTYAIAKHKLFNVKVLTTEIFTFTLWSLILVRIYISDRLQDQVVDSIALVVAIVIGVLLIKSVKREVEQREKIEELAKNLEKTNNNLEHANERLKELDQLKSEFMSMASHQIRSPLTAIKGYTSEILEEDFGELPEYLKTPLKTVYKSSESLLEVVEDFLNISRIEQGRMQYDFRNVNLSDLIQEVVSENKPKVIERGISLSFNRPKQNFVIKADFGKLKQVIGNLVDNSIKYTPHGAVRISVLRSGKYQVLVKISDTGIGMTEKTISSLFQKFTRAEEARKANIQGTGLGLYVVKEIVKAHKGEVWAESDGIGKGSTFWIRLHLIF